MSFSQPVKPEHVVSLLSRSKLYEKVAEVFLGSTNLAAAATEAL